MDTPTTKAKKLRDAEKVILTAPYTHSDLTKIIKDEKLPDQERKKIELVFKGWVSLKEVSAAINVIHLLCTSVNTDVEDKLTAFLTLNKYLPSEAIEILNIWRDTLNYLRDKELSETVLLLTRIAKTHGIIDIERINTAVTLYNRMFIPTCYDCFADIAYDNNVNFTLRNEACRYLVASEDEDNISLAQDCLISLIDNAEISSKDRYALIVGYIKRTGLASIMNAGKLKVPYNEGFVYGLQSAFIHNESTNIRDRILSAQHILGMSKDTVSDDEKDRIVKLLLDIALDKANTENTRADAADVVVRMGKQESIYQARKIIVELGYSSIGKGILKNVKHLFNNSQNIHTISASSMVEKFTQKMIKDAPEKRPNFEEVQTEIIKCINGKKLDPEKTRAAKAAIYRASIDTATFTEHKATTTEILIFIWMHIHSRKNQKEIAFLENRLVEELVDMGDTCSSGHADRFVNALSDVDIEFRIDWKDQIIANVAGRMKAALRNHPNPDEKSIIEAGMLDPEDGGTAEDRQVYLSWAKKTLELLKTELHKEFVDNKYIDNATFTNTFDIAYKQWIPS